jgi:hypothetical protein
VCQVVRHGLRHQGAGEDAGGAGAGQQGADGEAQLIEQISGGELGEDAGAPSARMCRWPRSVSAATADFMSTSVSPATMTSACAAERRWTAPPLCGRTWR